MARPLVFLLHGMGTHTGGWAKDAIAALQTQASALNSNWTLEFHALEYDSRFQELLKAWAKNSKEILANAQPANVGMLKDIVGWLGNANQGSFAWTAAADVFLWRTSSTIRKLIINHLANQVASRIAKAPAGQARNVHFVAHSLGTAVLHELLTALAQGAWTPDPGQSPNGFAATRWRPMAIHMVANVSKALELERNSVYDSPVRPGPPADPNSYSQFYRSYGHRFDPFAHIAPFRPPWASNARFGSYEPIHIRDPKKVHAFDHYLALPLVHVPMLESMFGRLPMGSAALSVIPPGFKSPSKQVEDSLRAEIARFGIDPSLFDLVRSVHDFFV